MKRIGIFGTSGFAREVGDIAVILGLEPIYVARDKSEADAFTFNGEVILERDLLQLRGAEFAIGIGDNQVRRQVSARYSNQLRFTNLIHPSASFGNGQLATIAGRKGVIICAGVRFTNNIQIGNFTIVNLNVTIGHDVFCDDFVNIAPGANISGNVHIEAGCWIGTGAIINQGDAVTKLRIGSNTTIGSGSVVVKACDHDALYVGIPAKRIK
jgi:sugar O-acyltransferase (sialic acid O-acetyltransferase NeuD family)